MYAYYHPDRDPNNISGNSIPFLPSVLLSDDCSPWLHVMRDKENSNKKGNSTSIQMDPEEMMMSE